MEITNDTVKQLAGLSRLHFEESDLPKLREDLSRMIHFVEKLQELDTTGIEPLLHMTDNLNVLREDEPRPALDRATAVSLAKDADHQYFYVPKVIKK